MSATFVRRALRTGLPAACAGFGAASANAQAGPDDEAPLANVVVVGARASLQSAQAIKEESLPVIDSVVADDILKLPDFSVSDALQRITGVQIARDRGDGTGVTVRGLTQVETTIDGREMFSAGTGRPLDFADIPAEVVAGIDVYKTSTASQLEGGVGGLVDLRTRRPFDFPGAEAVASARWVHGDLAGRTEPQFSTLVSQRWNSAGAGEIGVLLDASLQWRAFREDQKSAGAPLARTDLVAGSTVIVPNGTSETSSAGLRRRGAADLVVQWRPAPDRDFYAEAHVAELRTQQDSQQINIGASKTFAPGSVVLFPGTQDVQRITWTDAPVSILSFARDTVDRTHQFAIGGRIGAAPWTVTADLSRTNAFDNLFFSGPFFGATAGTFTQDLATRPPGTSVGDTDLLDPSAIAYTGVAYRLRPFHGHLTALRLDADRSLDGAWLRSLGGGLRIASRAADDQPGLIFGDTAVTGLTAADTPQLVEPNPYDDFFPGVAAPSLRHFLVGNLGLARDPAALHLALGITDPLPTAGSPLGVWTIDEGTQAAWTEARFESPDQRLDGNLGLRVVRTRERLGGFQSQPDTGDTVPLQVDSDYVDWLPSATLRWRPATGWVLRAAASRTVTRPDFNQLSPSLTLIPNPVDPSLNLGFAGNPELRPVRSSNVDLAIERYFSKTASAYATLFFKHVDGFVASVSSPELHDGQVYQVTRPQNSNPATLRGVEVGVQGFLDRLPGFWRGFGAQANVTLVDSSTPNASLGHSVPLQNLSRWSANLVGMYELGAWSARVAWNWRDRFLSGLVNVVDVGTLPAYTAAYAWLDASLAWRVNDQLTLRLEGTNLLGTIRRSDYGVATRPQNSWIDDRQVAVAATVRF